VNGATRAAAMVALLALTATGCSSPESEDAAVDTPTATSLPTTTSVPTTTSTTLPPTPQTTVSVETDPDKLAATIADSERELRSPDLTDEAARAAALEAQPAYRALSINPQLIETVVAKLPTDLREAARSNAEATTELRKLTKPGKGLPPWEIVVPAPADELYGYYKAAEAEFGVPWAYLAAIHLVETRMGRIRGTSTAGAQGPMQFLPSTWEAYGEGDINSNRDAIRAAARYLKRNGAPERMANALFNYNRSDRYVRAVTLHAEVMLADERASSGARANGGAPGAYRGFHQWQVWYRLPDGDVLLPEGWSNTAP
jgi:membrane-bound lytic murein transglycosylase B